MAVVLDQRVYLALAGQGLHHSDVDPAGGLGLAAADGADHTLADAQKRLQPLLPLLEQFRAMELELPRFRGRVAAWMSSGFWGFGERIRLRLKSVVPLEVGR
ncbi:MAG: hypothetical protein BroJett026_17670 [Betaproteobacteria bacterium]|nr:MAG: hypothetical protein BroJett026_17670 [Betaproteobacteria bacterium]